MKLDSATLTNFRCFKNEMIAFSSYTAIVGPNNSGKSTVFKAIDSFFRTTQKSNPLTLSDFNDPKAELRIALTFSNLPEKAQKDFDHYYRHGKLEFFIKASADASGQIEASVHGKRLGIAAFAGFFAIKGAGEQKAYYNNLKEQFPELPNLPARNSVDVFSAALYEYEEQNPGKRELIDSEDLAFGAAGVAAKLRRFVDWVYIPAVKDAADEDEEAKNTAFGVLINRIIRARVKVDEKVAAIQHVAHDQIKVLVEDYKDEVKKLESVLDSEFRKITSTDAHVHLDWTEIDENSVSLQLPLVRSILSDETFRGEISRFGHGLQRNYLMTLVHLNAKLALDDQPSIILACEEPELYQHPPQARYLHTALQKISESDQILVTTHSPLFISARTFENVRVVRKTAQNLSKVSFWTADQHRSLIAKAIGGKPMGEQAALAQLERFIQPELNEAFFCSKLVLVEGLEDRSLITTSLEQIGVFDDFLRFGGHIVGVNGKGNLINMIALAQGFETPHFVIFDADTNCAADQQDHNKTINSTLISLLQLAQEECVWPNNNKFLDRAIIWKEDIQSAISADYKKWYDDVRAVCATFGWEYDRLKKNPSVLARSLENVFESKIKIGCLNQAVEKLMIFAKS